MDSIIVITGVNKCSQPNNKSHSLCSKDYIYRLFSDLLLLHLQTFSSVQAMTHLCSIRYEILVHNQIVYRKFMHYTTQHNTLHYQLIGGFVSHKQDKDQPANTNSIRLSDPALRFVARC
jgi:hypothetical protein